MKKHYLKEPSQETIVKVLKKAHPNFERPQQNCDRVHKGKDIIRDFIRKKEAEGTPVKDDEILVVSHSKTLKFFCDVYDRNGEPVIGEDIFFENAKIRKHFISY